MHGLVHCKTEPSHYSYDLDPCDCLDHAAYWQRLNAYAEDNRSISGYSHPFHSLLFSASPPSAVTINVG